MIFALFPEAHAAEVRQPGLRRLRRVGGAVPRQHVFGDLRKTDSADDGHGAREAAVDHLRSEPQRFEDLGAAVRRERRDTHLGQHLEQALFRRRAKLEPGLARCGTGCVGRLAPLLLRKQRLDRLEREPRVHRLRPVADQRGAVVHVPGITRLRHEAGPRAQALAEQVLMHGADGEQHRDRRVVPVGCTVAHDDDARPLADRAGRRARELVERGAKCVGFSGRLPGRGKGGRGHASHVLQRSHLLL